MSDTKPIQYGGSLSLAKLAEAIASDEALVGPLKALAAGASDNYAIFKRTFAPDVSVELVTGTEAPDGFEKVCVGKLWVLDALLDVTAVRKTG